MYRSQFIVILLTCMGLFTECEHNSKLIEDPASYIQSVEQWQADRLEGLKGKDGWLNLAGIYWLEEGRQRPSGCKGWRGSVL